jgi:hypothetical protein
MQSLKLKKERHNKPGILEAEIEVVLDADSVISHAR